MAEKITYETKWMLIKDVLEYFESESDLLLALQEGAVTAYGIRETDEDIVRQEEGLDMTLDNGAYPTKEKEKIKSIDWVNYKHDFVNNRLSWHYEHRTGDFGFGDYTNIVVLASDLFSMFLGQDNNHHTEFRQTLINRKNIKHYSYIEFIGEVFLSLKSRSNNQTAPAKIVWDYLISNRSSFPKFISDYVDDGGDDYIVWVNHTGHLSNMGFDRFKNIISEFNTGQRKLEIIQDF